MREDEKPRLVRDLGDKHFFMLRNHGLITVADNVPDAFLLLYTFEAACMIQVRAQAGGGELVPIDPRIIATGQQQAATVTQASGRGARLAGAAAQARPDRPFVPQLKRRRQKRCRCNLVSDCIARKENGYGK